MFENGVVFFSKVKLKREFREEICWGCAKVQRQPRYALDRGPNSGMAIFSDGLLKDSFSQSLLLDTCDLPTSEPGSFRFAGSGSNGGVKPFWTRFY